MDLERARRVQNLLNEKDVQDAFDDMEASVIAAWKAAKTDAEQKEQWHACQAIAKLRSRLKNYASDLSMASRGDGK